MKTFREAKEKDYIVRVYGCHQPTRLNTLRLGWSEDLKADGD